MSFNISRTFVFTDGKKYTTSQLESEFSNLANTINNANAGLYSWDRVNWTVRTFTGSGSITASTETVLVVKKGTGAATAVTLAASPVTGWMYFVKDGKGDANTNNITVTPASGTIDGAANKVISTSYGVLRLVYNGAEWSTL